MNRYCHNPKDAICRKGCAGNARCAYALPIATPHESHNDDSALMNVIDLFGLRHGGAMVDQAQPYWIELAVNGHGRTTCYGKTARIAAERALLKLREWGEFTQSATATSGETPRTNAAWKKHFPKDGERLMSFAYAIADTARQLERELSYANAAMREEGEIHSADRKAKP